MLDVLYTGYSGYFCGGPGGWHYGSYGWGGGWFGLLFNIALWVVLGAVAFTLVRWLLSLSRRSPETATPCVGNSPLEILRRRYASGEIDKNQYEEMRAQLGY